MCDESSLSFLSCCRIVSITCPAPSHFAPHGKSRGSLAYVRAQINTTAKAFGAVGLALFFLWKWAYVSWLFAGTVFISDKTFSFPLGSSTLRSLETELSQVSFSLEGLDHASKTHKIEEVQAESWGSITQKHGEGRLVGAGLTAWFIPLGVAGAKNSLQYFVVFAVFPHQASQAVISVFLFPLLSRVLILLFHSRAPHPRICL